MSNNRNEVVIETVNYNQKGLAQLLSETDIHLYHALKNSIYPGAKDESIAMVLACCKAKQYDPMMKPYHIVPMNVTDSLTKRKEYRDVIMPGIAAYRIDAHRSGVYMGLSEPEYGPLITQNLDGKSVTYPEWCKMVAKKLMPNGMIAEFVAKELWIENYAQGYQTMAPNAMWNKRSNGQLAKCTEAQALRKGFTQYVGALPTFEEIEGKHITAVATKEIDLAEEKKPIDATMIEFLKTKLLESQTEEAKMCNYFKIKSVNELNGEKYKDVIRMLDRKIADKRAAEELEINKWDPALSQQIDAELIQQETER